MQLKYNRQPSLGSTLIRTLIKLFIAIIVFIFAIFLIEKIKFPSPKKITKLKSQMTLKNFKGFLTFLFFVTLTLTSKGEEKIDIWKNNNTGNSNKESTEIQKIKKEKLKFKILMNKNSNQNRK